MTHWYDVPDEFDEMPDDYSEEEAQRSAEIADIEIPDVSWAKEIEEIPNPKTKIKEIDIADKFEKECKVVDEKVDSGEMSDAEFFGELICNRWPKERRHRTRCGLESIDLTYDDLGDVAEDKQFLIADAAGNPKPAQMKNEVKELIRRRDPAASQDLADEMLEDKEISKEAHDTISRQVRLSEK